MSLYVVLLGVQGAGKGVQAQFMARRYGIPHVSTGDLFRAMKHRDDALAREVRAILAAGALVSDEVTNRIVEDRLAQPDAAGGVIFDGYPRTVAQADWLTDFLQARGTRVTAALLMQLDLYDAFRRAFGRVAGADGTSYNIYSNDDGIAEWHFEDHPEGAYPPRLVGTDAHGQPLVRRSDDANAHAIIRRIDTFRTATAPLLDYYRQRGVLVEVDAAQPIDAVSARVAEVIDTRRPAQA